MDKRLKIRLFYEEQVIKFFESNPYLDNIGFAFPSYFRIGGAGIAIEDEFKISVEGKIPNPSEVPANVMSAFARHLWYAKHSLSSISVFKVPMEEIETFVICVNGYVDDGWDNSGSFVEIYDENGELVGAAAVPTFDEGEDWKWMDRPLRGNDFNTPAPPWSKEEAEERRGRRKEIRDLSQLCSLNSIPKAFISDYQAPNPIIYVGNLPPNRATANDVRAIFAEYGTVRQIHLSNDSNGESLAFVEMTQEDRARIAVAEINGTEFLKYQLEVILCPPIRSNYSSGNNET